MTDSNYKLKQKAAEIAWSQNGTLAAPNNYLSNPKFDEYLATTGRGAGLDYCLAFIYWSFSKASLELGVPNPLQINGLNTAHVPTFYNLAKAKNLVVDSPQPGDIGVSKDLGHAVFVLRINQTEGQIPAFILAPPPPVPDPGKDMLTIEGNTYIGAETDKKWGVHKRSKSTSKHFFVRI